MTIDDHYSTSGMAVNNNLSATITNINLNGHQHHGENCSVNSSMSSSSSSCSIVQQQTTLSCTMKMMNGSQQTLSTTQAKLDERENDSGIEKDDTNSIFIRVSITDQNIQVRILFLVYRFNFYGKLYILMVKDINYGD